MTIVKRMAWYADYCFEALNPEAVKELSAIGERLRTPAHRVNAPIVLRLFECYLQLTRQVVALRDLQRKSFFDVSMGFLGALHSPQFIKVGPATANKSRCFLEMLGELQSKHLAPAISIGLRSSGDAAEEIVPWKVRFETQPRDEQAEWLWRGWIARNKLGVRSFLPLYPVWRTAGRTFTDSFFQVCSEYYAARATTTFPLLSSFTKHFLTYEGRDLAARFEDPDFVSEFFLSFFESYFTSGYAAGQKVEVMIDQWSRFASFSEEHLLGRVMAKPFCPLPRPQTGSCQEMRNLRASGEGRRAFLTLLTPIPLEVSDDQALRLLFDQIERDLLTVKQWARLEVANHWARHQQCLQNAAEGVAYEYGVSGRNTGTRWLVDERNPDRFKNAAATFQRHGIRPSWADKVLRLYPTPIEEVTKALGLPYRTSLLAHGALLVAEHPRITTTFLERLNLYDKDGTQSGFVPTDAGYYLVGEKPRRGSGDSQQRVLLNAETTDVIRQVIELTEPLRRYLRERNNDLWRRLFLETSSITTEPKPAQLQAAASAPRDRCALQSRIQETLGLRAPDAFRIAEGLTLKRVRASAGVVVYLATGSEEEMSKALGHKRFRPELLGRYLPKVLQDYFQERWVRLFQTGVILEAMKDSALLLEASGFKSMAQVDEFLSNHCLKHIPPCLDDDVEIATTHPSGGRSIRFGLDFGVLTMLVSIVLAVESADRGVSASASKWAAIGRRLIDYIRSGSDRPDIETMLIEAEGAANVMLAEELVYANS